MFLLASIKQNAADRRMLHRFQGRAGKPRLGRLNSRGGVAGQGFWQCHKQFGSHFGPEAGLYTSSATQTRSSGSSCHPMLTITNQAGMAKLCVTSKHYCIALSPYWIDFPVRCPQWGASCRKSHLTGSLNLETGQESSARPLLVSTQAQNKLLASYLREGRRA